MADDKQKKKRGRPPKKPMVEYDGTLPWDKSDEDEIVPWENEYGVGASGLSSRDNQ